MRWVALNYQSELQLKVNADMNGVDGC